MKFVAVVEIETDSYEHALQVLNERLNYEEVLRDVDTDEEFDYWINRVGRMVEQVER